MEKVFKRLLSFAVVLVMVLSMVPAAALAAEEAPVLPTATVTEIENENLTFALNFTADEVDQPVLDYYSNWLADYVLTVNKDVTFNADGTADGWLSGQYDNYDPDSWVNVPFEAVTLKAGESIKIMEYAMKLLGSEDPFTYGMVYEGVKSFNCGVFLDEEFLAANPDFEVTLELRMYNPANLDENYLIGETYEFAAADVAAPALPTATVTEIENENLTFALNFTADEVDQPVLDYYSDWLADYVLTVNKDTTFNADGTADGWLSGQYDNYDPDSWVNVPFETVTLKAGESIKIMEYAMKLMNYQNAFTYGMVYEGVKSFNCGVFFDEEFLAANPDFEVTLELRVYNPANLDENYLIGRTYKFSVAPKSEIAQIGSVAYATLQEAVSAAKPGDTIELIDDVVLTEPLVIPSNVAKRSTQTTTGDVEIDLAGQTISQSEECTAHYGMITNYGNLTITDSVGGGKISFTDTGAGDPDFGWGSYTIINYGTLTVNGGTIENLSTQNPGNGQPVVHMYCAIQQSAGSTTINDGTISNPTYRSVRVNKGDLVINGGEFVGQVWLQPNQGDVTMTITDGEFSPSGNDGSSVFMTNEGENYTVSEAQIVGGTFNTKIGATNAAALPGVIYGGTFTETAKNGTNTALLADGYEMVSNADGMYNVQSTEKPELPTATATKIENESLTFAMTFVADEATPAQQAYYGQWYADYVLTVNKDVSFNADGGADGWLSGQYDAWSENWVNVPYGKGNVTLKAGEGLQIMKFAAELMGKTGLRYTYQEVLNKVKEFNCGVFFTEEFLAANPDLEVTLELRIYNPADETENYKIGDTYLFYLGTPELPTATATEIENDDLTFAMNFKADKATAAQLDYYGPWYADYVLTINKDVTFNADGGADGWLSGQYDAWSENWVNVPYGKGNVTLKAGEGLQIMKFAAELMGKTGLRYTYQEVYDRVKDFDCGVFFTEEFLAANPDLEVTLELRIYNPADETENYKIGETYVFTLSDFVAENVNTGVQYSTVAAALEASQEGETVRLLKDVTGEKAEEMILILNDRTLNLNGFTLEATNVIAVTGGAKIQDSSNGAGLLKVAKSNLTLPYNDQLPYWIENDGGFRFVTVQFGIQQGSKTTEELVLYYWFEGALDRADLRAELENVENHGLSVYLRVSYKMIDGQMAELDIRVPNTKLATYATWVGAPAFQTTIKGLENVSEVTITPYVAYETVEICTDAVYDYSNATE